MTDKGRDRRKISLLFPAVFAIFVLIYAAGNYYVGLRFFQSIQSLIEPYSLFYWSSYAFLATSLFAARLGKRFYPGYINDLVAATGNYWLGAIYYSLLIWAGTDTLHILTSFIFPEAQIIKYPSFYWGFVILSFVSLLLLYGTWNARHPLIVHYDITIKKAVHNLPELHVVMVSDIHLGFVVDSDCLKAMVNRINELDPDIVFLAGDTIDEDVKLFVDNKMPEILNKLRSKYGVYAVLGNHEYIGGNSKLAVEHLQQAGINVLVDKCIKVNNQFYVAGRDDRMAGRVNGKQRLELSGILDGIDHSLPIILLDHQPINLEEGQLNGIDLQLSGHTHNGQFFPNTLISKCVFENSWGYLRKGGCQIIVSAGFGTWGPPIRIGSNSEITDITISFVESNV
ncbi:Phosphoesterase [Methanosarcina horonobensis HB-1 = JCM 15518]|uniref:Phosphoesterase n=1 Tax=Methanosarcina horonobensis HB-1 = JCM 15518 TaxID=1434110 RepID=A0A0E3SA50_9EURY|nr:metallophosphoesterase [Methanosarcina horonobensis]AKB78534.1 Phosphoesterase [Methanosarcina horonobensis HB-1 = JCM 15518]